MKHEYGCMIYFGCKCKNSAEKEILPILKELIYLKNVSDLYKGNWRHDAQVKRAWKRAEELVERLT